MQPYPQPRKQPAPAPSMDVLVNVEATLNLLTPIYGFWPILPTNPFRELRLSPAEYADVEWELKQMQDNFSKAEAQQKIISMAAIAAHQFTRTGAALYSAAYDRIVRKRENGGIDDHASSNSNGADDSQSYDNDRFDFLDDMSIPSDIDVSLLFEPVSSQLVDSVTGSSQSTTDDHAMSDAASSDTLLETPTTKIEETAEKSKPSLPVTPVPIRKTRAAPPSASVARKVQAIKEQLQASPSKDRKTVSSTQARVAKAKATVTLTRAAVQSKIVNQKTKSAARSTLKKPVTIQSPAPTRAQFTTGTKTVTFERPATVEGPAQKNMLGATTKPAQPRVAPRSYAPLRTLPTPKPKQDAALTKPASKVPAPGASKPKPPAAEKSSGKPMSSKATPSTVPAPRRPTTRPAPASTSARSTATARSVSTPSAEPTLRELEVQQLPFKYPLRNRIASLASMRAPVQAAA